MALFLEILNGDLRGQRTPVRDGLIIGRKAAGLTIKDSKLSGKHARIESRPDGTFWIVDLGSSNGIKFGDLRVREVKLEPGNGFVLGRTGFTVISSDEKPAPAEDSPDTESEAPAMTVTRTFWDNIRELAERGAQTKVQKRDVAAFNPVVRLKFIRGIQSGTEWTVGYGPRSVGTASLDLTLEDPALPGICFRLEPQHQGVLLKNESERAVKLNGKPVGSELLKDGDIIEIANTQIQIEFEPLDGP